MKNHTFVKNRSPTPSCDPFLRISEKEKADLTRRAKSEGTTTGGLVRRLIREKPFVVAADLLAEMDALMGDKRLAVRPRK